MSTFEFPTRRGLVVGIALVALYALRDELVAEANRRAAPLFAQHNEYQRCIEAIEAVACGSVLHTENIRIRDTLAYARQIARVSYEEWEQCVPIRVAA